MLELMVGVAILRIVRSHGAMILGFGIFCAMLKLIWGGEGRGSVVWEISGVGSLKWVRRLFCIYIYLSFSSY